MNEILDAKIPEEKIYKSQAIWVGTFLGGPLVAGYLFAENFKSLDQPEKVKPTWIIAIISTVIIFGGVFLIPENINFPNQLIPLLYSLIAMGLFKKFQEKNATEHINSGGSIYSWWRVVGISIIGVLITMAALLPIVFATQQDELSAYETKTYGTFVKHEVSFDKTNISEKEVNRIADGLKEAVFFDLKVPKYIHVQKDGDLYVLLIAVVEGAENNEISVQYFSGLRDSMDDFFPNNNIEIRLVVDYVENVVKVLK